MNNGIHHFDLTQSQSLFWTGQQLSPDSPMYNMAFTFEINADLDVTIFQKAFQLLIQKSDVMRSTFELKNECPQQIVHPDFPYEVALLDFSEKPNPKDFLQKWVSTQVEKVFDISKCVFESVLIKMKEGHWVWYFNQHHLITDAWATTQQVDTFWKIYHDAISENPAEEIILPKFTDYIQFENTQRKPSAIEFWKNKTSELPDPPDFFGRLNRKLESRSERILVKLDNEKSDTLRALTQEKDLRTFSQDLSLFSIFSTLVFAYIYRVTGQQKVAIGTPAHNRTTAEFKKTLGVFIELFPMLAEVETKDTFSALFEKVRNEAFEFLKNAKAGTSNAEGSRSFNVVLNYINVAFSTFEKFPMKSNWVHSGHVDPGHHFRLQVYDFDGTGEIHLGFDLNEHIFDETQRKLVPSHFMKLLDSFIEDRFQMIGKPSLENSESNVFQKNETTFEYHANTTVLDLFEKKVTELPAEAVAVRYGEESLTYQELEHHANQLSHFLLQNGVEKNDRVAILLTRSPEFVISVLATLKAGGTFVPIPSNYPSGRILGILEDASPRLILSNETFAKKLPKTFDNLIQLDKESVFIQQQKTVRPTRSTAINDLAYLLYTSGSTGNPKGVMIAHASLAHYMQWANQKYAPDFRPIVPLFTSVGFDLTITSLFLPLIAGGEMITYQESEDGPDLSLFSVLEENQVNVIKLTPSHLTLLKGKHFHNSLLKSMIVGGENFKTDLAVFVKNNFSKTINIFNEYGPTEATVGCIVHEYDLEKDGQEVSVPIGIPIAHTPVFVLDEFQNQVPQGVVGELYIGGKGLAKGYWKQEDLTKEKFIKNPFEENEVLYRSGDLVAWNPSKNYFEYFGRKDLQVKIKGRRVELAEIESVLNQHPAIVQSVVELRHRQRAHQVEEVHNCVECGLPSNYPSATFNEAGVCHLCQSFTSYQEKVQKYFKTKEDLQKLFEEAPKDGEYDCLMLLSGGKDSSYATAKLKEMGLRVLTFTLDNGYISEEAKDNVRRIVGDLGIDHIFGETESMNEIFVDSLQRHCNVCDGCFKTIYTLSMQIALEKKIPFIVTGLSRGQFFETRLTEELFRSEEVDVEKIDEMILNARKAYHQVDDAVKELLDTSMFEDDEVFEKVKFIDFYRYTDVSLDEMLDYLNNCLPWVRPSDTGRSTNCLINQAGIYVHKKELGYSNYAFPYSWDVRIGHKTRQASLDEINEEINEKEVNRILNEIGYVEAEAHAERNEQLVAYYVASEAIDGAALRNYLLTHIPDYMIPVQFIALENFPITVNGKINRAALPQPDTIRPVLKIEYVAPRTEFEEIVQETWTEVMQIDEIGILDNFLDIGGDSLTGIRVISRLNEAFEIDLPVNLIFQKPTIAQLSGYIEEMIAELMQALEENSD